MPADDLDLLLDAARAAGDIAASYFKGSFSVEEKAGGQGPVTEADLKIDRMLRAELMAARPDYGWLSEETEDSAARLEHDRVFIVDPIDGTRSFVAGKRTFAHSLAISQGGRVTAAVVHLPMRGFTYQASLGHGAFLNGQKLTESGCTEMANARVIGTRQLFQPEHWPGGVPEIDRHFRPSLAYRLCLIAEGRFDAMVTLRDAWEWDIAAGDLICREAGVTISDRLGKELVFNNRNPTRPGVLAASPLVHAGLMSHLIPRD